MAHIPTRTVYLEMRSPRYRDVPKPLEEIAVEHTRPSIDDYRFLYSSVGKDYHWIDRLRLEDDQLIAIIQDDTVDIYILKVRGDVAGYAELDRRIPDEVEIAYFGLLPEFVGKGLGKYFLCWAVNKAWAHQPRRVWVHTCDLDHPAALSNYLKAGFEIYDQNVIDQFVEDGVGE